MTQRFRKAQVYCANSYSDPFVGCIIASLADVLLACHAILPNERLLKRVVKNVDQSQHTSRFGK